MQARGEARSILLISSTGMSQVLDNLTGGRPHPEFAALLEHIDASVLDTSNVVGVKRPLVDALRNRLSTVYAVTAAALLNLSHYRLIIATDEKIALPLALVFKLAGIRKPLIMACHNITTPRRAFLLAKLRLHTSISLFQCLAPAQAEQLRSYGVPAEKIQILNWYVDDRFFTPRPERAMPRLVCSAGMASRDYATLVAAVRGLDVELKIAADSSWYRETVNVSHDELPGNVQMRSYGDYVGLRSLYASAQFVVVPLIDADYAAGYSVILEAMAMGKAVITTRTKQPGAFTRDGWNGFLVAPGDAHALRERMQYLLDNPAEARRMGDNARRDVEERFALQHYVERMQAAIELVTRQGRP